MKNKFFSKSYKNIFKHKKVFYEKNDDELIRVKKINKLYTKLPLRKNCKICNKKFKKEHDFISFGVKYSFCKFCSHLNGHHEETVNFLESLYKIDKKEVSSNIVYDLKNLNKRINDIYLPKIKFLKKIIGKKKITILDYGSGAGYFMNACDKVGYKCYGIEKDKKLIKLSNQINKLPSNFINLNMLKDFINDNKIDCVSAINVLEHLENPIKFLKIFSSSNAKYLFISVPLVSFTIFLENAFSNVFPKQLGGAHTHLFTKKSLLVLFKKMNLEIIGEWWFGTDMPDLYRSIFISNKFNNKDVFNKQFNMLFSKYIDEFQNIFDRNEVSQEVHMILRKND